MLQSMGSQRVGHARATELVLLSNVDTSVYFSLLRKILWFPMGFQASWQTYMSYLGPRRTPWHPSAHMLRVAITVKSKPDSILDVSFTLTFVFCCFCYTFITKRLLPIA